MDEGLLEQHDGHTPRDDQQDVEPEPLRSFQHQPRFTGRQRHPDQGRGLDHEQRDQRPGDQVVSANELRMNLIGPPLDLPENRGGKTNRFAPGVLLFPHRW